MGHIAVSHFCLGVNHLLNFEHALAALALDDLFSGHARLAALPGADDQFHELGVVDVFIIHERVISRARFMRRVEDTAIGVDLQHVDFAVCVHAEIAAGISIAAQFIEHAQGLFAKNFLDLRVSNYGD